MKPENTPSHPLNNWFCVLPMRLALIIVGIACVSVGCQVQQPSSTTAAPTAELTSEVEPAEVETFPSPDGRAALIYIDNMALDTVRLDRVLLVVAGDTTEVLSWDLGHRLGIEWFADNLARIWIPVGGNWNHAAVFVEPSSQRASPSFENDFAVDPEAETVVTYEIDAFKLRDLWTGQELGSWSPPNLDLGVLWQECGPSGSLAGRSATIRYDCGIGEQEREMRW